MRRSLGVDAVIRPIVTIPDAEWDKADAALTRGETNNCG
jgi:hypothetical protein